MTKQIPQGYKQTKVGIIPEDWKVMKLKHFIDELEAGVSVNSIDEPCIDDEYGVLKTSSLFNGKFIYTENKKIKQSELVKARLNPIEGNLLISRMNTPDLVGAIGLVNKTHLNLFLPDRLWQTKFSSRQEVNSCWLNSLLNTKQYKLIVRSLATGTSDSMKNISKKSFLEIEIPFPPIKEQDKIAEILSTWDESITKQEKLIKQQQVFKKGVMQQIFNQKLRFKDDNGNDYSAWQSKKLGDFLIFTPREVNKPTDNYLAIGVRSHAKGTFQKKDVAPTSNTMDKMYLVRENDLIVNITFAWEGAIAIVKSSDDGGYVSHRFPTYTFNPASAISSYFKFIICRKHFISMLDLISPGGAGRNRVLSKNAFMNLSVNLPCVHEQTKIADFLTSVDNEISKQTEILDQLKLQKQSLMQKLLTGQVRVKYES